MKYDVVVVGSGIVGLSVAYNLVLKRPGLSIAIVDKEADVAVHQTGRNSGVIHSGIYYKPGSAKAINCKQGYRLMLDFCKEHGIAHEICGKLIVASDSSEEPQLQKIYQRGLANGLNGLEIMNAEQFKQKEPYLRGTKAIFVPQTGIVNYKHVSLKLKQILVENRVAFHFGTEVSNIRSSGAAIELISKKKTLETRFLVNCGGLYCDKIAKMCGIKLNAKIIPFRGEYYLLKEEKKYLVKNLIYPVPNPNFPFLGVHFTRRISGEIDAGPNAVLAFKREGYTKTEIDIKELTESIGYKGFIKVASKYWKEGIYEMYRSYSKKAFVKALQKLVPEIVASDLVPGMSGVRAQLCDDQGNLVDDFMIEHTQNAVHVINAPSPAATSSLQIGKSISEKILSKLI